MEITAYNEFDNSLTDNQMPTVQASKEWNGLTTPTATQTDISHSSPEVQMTSSDRNCRNFKIGEKKMTKIGFICVHNSCRSQIAEALGRHLASDILECYSAGTETKPQINKDAVRLMKQIYGIDMETTQHSKLLTEIPPLDIVITMGCNVQCPILPCKHREDWGLSDPTGKSDDEFIIVIKEIEKRIMQLKNSL